MSNPVLVEVTRGPLVESRHRGAVAVADIEGRSVFAVGDIAAPVFPRSAIKALQAIALVECGAADRYGFGDEDLALACASHSGEPAHVAGVARMLAKAGLDTSALRCGAHWPMSQSAAYALARSGTPSALHNNCSGKHAGFLCLACAMGVDTAEYFRPQHPVQQEVRAVLENFAGAVLGEDVCAIDGCSVPTWAMPLQNLAHGFAKFGAGHGLPPARAAAAARLRQACAAKPWFVAGTGGSAPRSWSFLASAFSSKLAPKASIAARCRDKGSASRLNAMTAPVAPRRPSWRRRSRAFCRSRRPSVRRWRR